MENTKTTCLNSNQYPWQILTGTGVKIAGIVLMTMDHLHQMFIAPKRGSWLNMAELSVLSRAGLPERIPNVEQLKREVSQWVATRNQSSKGLVWRLTAENARVKLASLYLQLVA